MEQLEKNLNRIIGIKKTTTKNEFKMKSSIFNTKIEKVIDAKSVREDFHYVYFTKDRIYATDGQILISTTYEKHGLEKDRESLEGRKLHVNGIKTLSRLTNFRVEGDEIIGNKNGQEIRVNLPKYGLEIPSFEAVIPREPEQIGEIGINAGFLYRLSEAILQNPKNGALKLEFHGKNGGILVTEATGDDSDIGLIMPVVL